MCKVTMIMRVICLYSQDKDIQDRDCPFADEAVALLGQEEELKLNKLWKTLAWLWFWCLYSKYKTGISFIFWHSRGHIFWFPSHKSQNLQISFKNNWQYRRGTLVEKWKWEKWTYYWQCPAGRVFQYQVGAGRVFDKIPGSRWGSGRVGVSKNTIGYFRVSFLLSGISGYFGYFRVCRVFPGMSGISGFTHIY